MNRKKWNSEVAERLGLLEFRLFELVMVLLAGGFIVLGGLLSVIAALILLAR